MPLNRTNQKMQARSPGMVLHSGNIITGAGGVVSVHNGDPGVTATRVGVGLYDISFPAEGNLTVRDAHADCTDPAAYTQRDWSGDGRVLTITTLNGAPSAGGGSGTESFTYWKEADTADADTVSNRLLFAAPVAGTINQVTVTLEADASGAGQEPTESAVWSLEYGDNSAIAFPTTPGAAPGASPALANVLGPNASDARLAIGGGIPSTADTDIYSPMRAYVPYNIPISPFAMGRGDVLTFDIEKAPDPGDITLPNHLITVQFTPTGGGGGGAGVATDFDDTIISYHVWLKNSSAR